MGEILVFFSTGKWGTSKNLWGFMGTPCFFQRKPNMVQDVVDLVCFCGESFCFTSFGCILKMCEHVLPISLFNMCFICLQCLDVFKTIRLIAMGIGGQTWSFRGLNGDHRKKWDSKQQKQGSNLKKMTKNIGFSNFQNIGT
jgi:hypothetical protein